MDKYYYRATRAQKEYKTVLSESRAGINATEEEIKALDDIVTPLIKNGQSVYMILQNRPEITQREKPFTTTLTPVSFPFANLIFPRKSPIGPDRLMALKWMIPVFLKEEPTKTWKLI